MDSGKIEFTDKVTGEIITFAPDEQSLEQLVELGSRYYKQYILHRDGLREIEKILRGVSEELSGQRRDTDKCLIVNKEVSYWYEDQVHGVLMEVGGWSEEQIKQLENKPQPPRNKYSKTKLNNLIKQGGRLAKALTSAMSTQVENKITWKK